MSFISKEGSNVFLSFDNFVGDAEKCGLEQ